MARVLFALEHHSVFGLMVFCMILQFVEKLYIYLLVLYGMMMHGCGEWESESEKKWSKCKWQTSSSDLWLKTRNENIIILHFLFIRRFLSQINFANDNNAAFVTFKPSTFKRYLPVCCAEVNNTIYHFEEVELYFFVLFHFISVFIQLYYFDMVVFLHSSKCEWKWEKKNRRRDSKWEREM